MLGAAAGRSLIGHAAHPLDEIFLEETMECEDHEADGAIAADEILYAGIDSAVDHMSVHGVEDDDAVGIHPLGAGGIDPVPVPSLLSQLRKDLLRILPALASDDGVVLEKG